MDEIDTIDTTTPEVIYDRHKLVKMLLIAAASFAVAKAIETTYDGVRARRASSPSEPTTED